MAMQAPKQKHHPSAPMNRRGTLATIAQREAAATDFGGRSFARKECRGRAAKNKGGKPSGAKKK